MERAASVNLTQPLARPSNHCPKTRHAPRAHSCRAHSDSFLPELKQSSNRNQNNKMWSYNVMLGFPKVKLTVSSLNNCVNITKTGVQCAQPLMSIDLPAVNVML